MDATKVAGIKIQMDTLNLTKDAIVKRQAEIHHDMRGEVGASVYLIAFDFGVLAALQQVDALLKACTDNLLKEV